MSLISIRGVDHYYEWITASENTEPSGKPVMVFLHGWAGSARYWESTAHVLAGTFDCLLYDMRGFGRTCLPQAIDTVVDPGYELETYAEDLALLLDALRLNRVYLNAHSTGSSIATFFLNLYPERVERAILTCSGIFEYDEKAFSAFHKFGGYVVKFRPAWLSRIPLANRFFMARFLHRSLPDPISQAFLEDFILADQAAALGTMITAVSKKAAEVMPLEFAKLTVPTLLVAGEYDLIIPAAMGRQAANLNEKVEFALIPNTAHFPMLEDPETYLQRVQEFLQIPVKA
jgi:pimeloyl-ACP methyl ester carboxylesterase